jgi:hypothetical protein
MQNEPAVVAQPAVVGPKSNVAGRVAAWTASLVALAALLEATTGVVNNAQLLSCKSFGITLPACPPTQAVQKPSDATTKVNTPVTNQNNQYSIYLFFTGPRATEAKAVADGLAATGFQVTKVLSTLEETGLKLTAGTTFILPSTSDKGDEIRFKVGEIVQKNLPNSRKAAVTLGDAYAIKSGDIQVQLY